MALEVWSKSDTTKRGAGEFEPQKKKFDIIKQWGHHSQKWQSEDEASLQWFVSE